MGFHTVAYNQHNNKFYHNKILVITAIAKHRNILCIFLKRKKKSNKMHVYPTQYICFFRYGSINVCICFFGVLFRWGFFCQGISELKQTFRMHMHSDTHIPMQTQKECKISIYLLINYQEDKSLEVASTHYWKQIFTLFFKSFRI